MLKSDIHRYEEILANIPNVKILTKYHLERDHFT